MKTNSRSRRNFLLAAGLGGAGAVAAVATSRTQKPAGAKTVAASEGSGYRVSEHILKYYKTTEV